MSEWKDVYDELPSKDGKYLVYNGESHDPERQVCKYTKSTGWDIGEDYCRIKVTHWTYLVEPPEMKEKDEILCN